MQAKAILINSPLEGENQVKAIYFLKLSVLKIILTIFLSLFTGTMFLVVLYWSCYWRRKCLFSYADALTWTYAYVCNWDDNYTICKKQQLKSENLEAEGPGIINRFLAY